METIVAAEVTSRLAELLDRTAHGETFQITRDGRLVGRLMPPVQAYDRMAAAAAVRQLKGMRGALADVQAADLRGLAHNGHRY